MEVGNVSRGGGVQRPQGEDKAASKKQIAKQDEKEANDNAAEEKQELKLSDNTEEHKAKNVNVEA